METNALLTRLSRTLSYLLHPLLIPTLGVFLLVYGQTVMGGISPRVKWFFLSIVFLNTFVIPLLGIGLLKTLRLIPDLSLSEPRQRILPIVIVAVGYLCCAWMLRDVAMAFLIQRFLFAALACLALTALVTPFWKISLHMTAIGGLLAMLALLNFSGFGQFPYTLLSFLLLAGMLGSARLWLGSHNLLQVAAGFCGGFLIASLTILYI